MLQHPKPQRLFDPMHVGTGASAAC